MKTYEDGLEEKLASHASFLFEGGGIGLSTFFRSNFQACHESAFQLLPLGILGGQGQEKANMETLPDKPTMN